MPELGSVSMFYRWKLLSPHGKELPGIYKKSLSTTTKPYLYTLAIHAPAGLQRQVKKAIGGEEDEEREINFLFPPSALRPCSARREASFVPPPLLLLTLVANKKRSEKVPGICGKGGKGREGCRQISSSSLELSVFFVPPDLSPSPRTVFFLCAQNRIRENVEGGLNRKEKEEEKGDLYSGKVSEDTSSSSFCISPLSYWWDKENRTYFTICTRNTPDSHTNRRWFEAVHGTF